MTMLLTSCASLNSDLKSRQLTLQRQWVVQTTQPHYIGYRHFNQMSPAIYEDIVLQGNATDGIVGVHLKKGQVEWKLDVPTGVSSGAQVGKGRAYFGGSDGQFYAVEPFTGRKIWTFPTRAENLAAPLFHEDSIYFLSGNDVVFALNAETGRQKWVYSRNSTVDLSVRGGTKPAFYQNVLYIGFSDGFLVALNPADGSLRWERQLGTAPKFRDVDSSPVVDDKFIYAASFDNSLYCLSRADGQVVWRFEEGGAYPPAVQGNFVYFATSSGKLVALNRNNGELVWSRKLDHGIATQPTTHQGFLIYGESEGLLRVVDSTTGVDVASYAPGRGVNSQPIVDPKTNQVIFMSTEGNLHSIELKWVGDQELRPYRVKL